MMKDILNEELAKIEDSGLRRKMRVISSAPDRGIVINGRPYLNFSSNSYLGLSVHPAVKKASAAALEKYGSGGTSSRLVAGTLDLHEELEGRLASLKKTEAGLVFPSGYQTNVGVIGSLLSEGDCLVMDRLNHASLWDAARLSRARVFVYAHRDMGSLEKVLRRAKNYRRTLIATDSVFSMDGDLAPLKDIVFLASKYGAWTMIDEAHATGIFGAGGRGLAEHCGVEGKIDIVMGTLSKALASQGGFVCGPRALVEYLVNRCRSFIYTTAPAPALCGAALAALETVEKEPERRQRLLSLSKALREKLQATGFNVCGSESQIVPLFVGPVTETVSLAAKLWKDGIYAPAIRPPTVPEGRSRLRFSLTSSHTPEDVRRLISSIME
ncbi:MAG: 8-amino-7-oxononanoate synthase [Endomicrobiales bacterium]